MWGTDYFCIERKKKFGLKKCGGALCDGAYRIFLLGGVMQKVKWAKMGSFCNIFCIGLGRFDRFLKWV
ncbi:hypothetical protein [Glaesserella parasuis]|uniref:hypothetical protein n=1 Tax=Glaesserella parasuis TaxID=738 RepID=UPI003CEA9825